jgi:hypothetical protein
LAGGQRRLAVADGGSERRRGAGVLVRELRDTRGATEPRGGGGGIEALLAT